MLYYALDASSKLGVKQQDKTAENLHNRFFETDRFLLFKDATTAESLAYDDNPIYVLTINAEPSELKNLGINVIEKKNINVKALALHPLNHADHISLNSVYFARNATFTTKATRKEIDLSQLEASRKKATVIDFPDVEGPFEKGFDINIEPREEDDPEVVANRLKAEAMAGSTRKSEKKITLFKKPTPGKQEQNKELTFKSPSDEPKIPVIDTTNPSPIEIPAKQDNILPKTTIDTTGIEVILSPEDELALKDSKQDDLDPKTVIRNYGPETEEKPAKPDSVIILKNVPEVEDKLPQKPAEKQDDSIIILKNVPEVEDKLPQKPTEKQDDSIIILKNVPEKLSETDKEESGEPVDLSVPISPPLRPKDPTRPIVGFSKESVKKSPVEVPVSVPSVSEKPAEKQDDPKTVIKNNAPDGKESAKKPDAPEPVPVPGDGPQPVPVPVPPKPPVQPKPVAKRRYTAQILAAIAFVLTSLAVAFGNVFPAIAALLLKAGLVIPATQATLIAVSLVTGFLAAAAVLAVWAGYEYLKEAYAYYKLSPEERYNKTRDDLKEERKPLKVELRKTDKGINFVKQMKDLGANIPHAKFENHKLVPDKDNAYTRNQFNSFKVLCFRKVSKLPDAERDPAIQASIDEAKKKFKLK